ncbi:NADH-quinone oxidoreductase subunit J [Trueperella bialowiezensis]|uniref:NADH-quinone oxidoreductase subunit J n=1 Tax=Trueperella bialowiezensis TaxID=312285 RepID=A0A3S4WH03_9ACTO|nr:NADH-quinone oxidoreductase subunit J [Trueperella bialowiezensis]VEI13707.1 NADH-quinone oxidoreductase subunit J [Trueperella bialowiezensis]
MLEISLGEMIIFGVVAVMMVALALYGLLFARKAVHSVVCVIFIMVGLAVLYTAQEAPFLGVAQVVVYTGAILMMFLFVLMLIGVDSADSTHETLKGQRAVAVLGGLGVAAILIGVLLGAAHPPAVGLEAANTEGNPVGVAKSIFSNHVLTLQITGTLLIVAALGAMTLTHKDRLRPIVTQEERAHRKMRDFITKGTHVGHKPNPGVYAESNSSANPALTAYGQPEKGSVNRVLQIRGQVRTVGEISPKTVERIATGDGISGPSTYGKVGRSKLMGMPGEIAPDHDAALKRLEQLESGSGHTAELEAQEDDQ